MNILISGGTGFIGKKLRNNATRKGHIIRLITREDVNNKELLLEKIQWSTVVVNLAGASISKRWSESYKKEIYSSRIDTTKAISESIKDAQKKPKLFISVSAVGIYSSSKIQSEDDLQIGSDFLAQVCSDWEKVAHRASDDTRVVIYRLGVVLGKHGGIVKSLTSLFKYGLGASLGSGQQMMSWVHVDDVVNAFFYAIKNQSLSGVYNLVAPTPVSNKEFTSAFAKALNRKAFLRVPSFVIRLMKGEQASFILDEKYVLPKRLLEADFNFRNDTIQTAFKQIFRKKIILKNPSDSEINSDKKVPQSKEIQV